MRYPQRLKRWQVALYTFKLIEDGDVMEDDIGVNLPNDEIACEYACDVIGELMNKREQRTRAWQLDVYQDGTKVREVPFVNLDHTLDHLRPDARNKIEQICRQRRSVLVAIHDAELTLEESKALLARSRGKPYLATVGGKKIIRD